MKNKYFIVAIAVFVVVGAGLLIVNQKILQQKDKKPVTQSQTASKDQKVIEQLKSGQQVKDLDAYAALIRTSRKKDPEVFALGKNFANSENKLYRQAVAQMMSAYDNEESLTILKTLAEDPDISVRKFALRSLGQHPSREAIPHLQARVKQLQGEEKITALGAMYPSITDPEKQQSILKDLRQEYKKEDEHSVLAGLTLIRVAPRTEYGQKFMRTVLKNKTNSRVSVAALRTLSQQRDQWVMGQYESIAEWGNNEVARAIIQSLHRSCPKNRWKLMEMLVQPKTHPSVVRTALRELTLLPGPQAMAFLKKIEASHGNQPRIKQDLEKTSTRMKTEKLRNPCLPGA